MADNEQLSHAGLACLHWRSHRIRRCVVKRMWDRARSVCAMSILPEYSSCRGLRSLCRILYALSSSYYCHVLYPEMLSVTTAERPAIGDLRLLRLLHVRWPRLAESFLSGRAALFPGVESINTSTNQLQHGLHMSAGLVRSSRCTSDRCLLLVDVRCRPVCVAAFHAA